MPVEEPVYRGRTFVPSVNQVLRELKRQEVGLYNCVCSVLSDVAFVREISLLYSPLPLLANLRCGLWYAPKHDGTCYFKSTDGHYGNWGFSCTRLNLHTARLAAERGGCIIVDATRRGKSFPDAFTKTVPIWCTVLNRAISAVRQQLQQERCASADGKAEAVLQLPGWDCDLHLPAWVSANEANHISMRLDSWTRELLQVDADIGGLAKNLQKPLRALWISQNSRIWIDQTPDPGELPFTPVILVSASLPNARQRRFAGRRGNEEGGWTYEYVPGAGDDEESWARGLTPSLLHKHQEELMAAGPDAVHAAVEHILAEAQAVGNAAGSSVPMTHGAAGDAEGSLHNLAPLGARVAADAATVHRTGAGLYLIGNTGIALGRPADGHAGAVWQDIDAVLDCSLEPFSSPVNDQGNAAALGSKQSRSFLNLPVKDAKHDRHGLQANLPSALAFASRHLGQHRKVLVLCSGGHDTSVCVAVALLLACFSPSNAPSGSPCFKGVYTTKPAMASHADHCTSRNMSQLDDGGAKSDFCVHEPDSASEGAVAPNRDRAAGRHVLGQCPRHDGIRRQGKQQQGQQQSEVSAGTVSRDDIRRALAFVSACYPHARPSRGSLRQVYNFLLQSKGSDMAAMTRGTADL